jgi:hypothetical protein
MVRRDRKSRVWAQRRIARGIGTDRPFDRISDSAATRHPVGGTTRRRIGPNVGGPFDVRTVRRGHARAHRPTVMYRQGQMSVKRLASERAGAQTRAQARRRSRATSTASPAGRRIGRDGTRLRSRSASERVAVDSGSPWSVRAARRSATSAMAAAERAARRGAGSDTSGRSPRRGRQRFLPSGDVGAYQPYRASDGMPYPPDGPCGPPGSADGIPLTT